MPANSLPLAAEYWTDHEKWVWSCMLNNEDANFNGLYKVDTLNPEKDDDRWEDPCGPRLLSSRFLLDMLGRQQYLKAIPRRGLHIVGARCVETLELNDIEVEHSILLHGCRFDGAVNFENAKFRASLSLENSAFNQRVNMGLAEVGGQLNATAARFRTDLDMNSLKIGQNLFLSKGVFAGKVDLRAAKILGRFDASAAAFGADTNMNALTVEEHLRLAKARFKGTVDLVAARINGQLDATRTRFKAGLNMNSLTVGQHLFLEQARFAGRVDLTAAKVGGRLNAAGACFRGSVLFVFAEFGHLFNLGNARVESLLDANGMTVKGECRLYERIKWGSQARLVLRNARVGTLAANGTLALEESEQSSWPKPGNLELDGFTYERLSENRSSQSIRGYIDWLELDTACGPQPYLHLANVLRARGQPMGANDVLYAARQRERAEAWNAIDVGTEAQKARATLRWIGLSLLKWTIGYGLGGRYFRVLIWIGGFTALGAWFLWTDGAMNAAKGYSWCLWASFDWMLPFIELDKRHTDSVRELQGPVYFFYLQALVGYVLAGFLGAGLAGLTQSRS